MSDSENASVGSTSTSALLGLTAQIVAAFASHNNARPAELVDLIPTVHTALRGLTDGVAAPVVEERRAPPISVKKSITPDYLISMEDGRHYKSLKRHLSGKGMTPDEYKTKWGLPRDYPMVAANYARARSELAKQMGLGRKAGTKVTDAVADKPAAEKKTAAKKGGRVKKTAPVEQKEAA